VSVPLLFIAFAQELLNQLEIILLGFFGDARQAGLFGAAWRLASLVAFVLTTYGIVCGPVVASAYHKRNLVEVNRVVQFAARLTAISGALAILLLVMTGKFLLRLFGPEFDAAYPALLALLLGGAVNAYTGVVAYLLTLTGRERSAVTIFACAVLMSLVLNVLLIPLLGAVGAAIASSTTISSWNLAMVFWVRRQLGIDATAWGRPMLVVDPT
jgi:O-antigen/teichoic acid export membrane protein